MTFATILFVYSVYALPSMRQVFGFTHMSTEVRSLLARVLLGSMGRDPDHVSLWDLTIGHLINVHFVGEFPDGDEWWGGRFTLVSLNSMCGHYVPIIQVSDIRTAIEGRGWYSRLKLPGILRTPDIWVIGDHHRCFFSVDFDMLFDARQCGGPDGGYSEVYIWTGSNINTRMFKKVIGWLYTVTILSIYRMSILKDWVIPTNWAT